MAVNRTTLTLIAALALVGNASAQTGNLLVNGSFEEGSFTGDARTSYNHVGPYGTVVTVMGEIKAAGIDKLGMVAEEKREPAKK